LRVLRDLGVAISKPSVFSKAARLAGAGGSGIGEAQRVETQERTKRADFKSEKAAWRPRRLFVGNVFASVNVMEPL
jgi:hypothetical protein